MQQKDRHMVLMTHVLTFPFMGNKIAGIYAEITVKEDYTAENYQTFNLLALNPITKTLKIFMPTQLKNLQSIPTVNVII